MSATREAIEAASLRIRERAPGMAFAESVAFAAAVLDEAAPLMDGQDDDGSYEPFIIAEGWREDTSIRLVDATRLEALAFCWQASADGCAEKAEVLTDPDTAWRERWLARSEAFANCAADLRKLIPAAPGPAVVDDPALD